MEEEKGKDGDGCGTPDVQESICEGVSVLMMGSSSSFGSRDEVMLSGMMGNVLASAWSKHMDSGQNRPGEG